MGNPRISIAMCTYNGAKFVREQLDSIAAQTYSPYELVVCDDASGDDTVALLKGHVASAPYKAHLYENKTNLGTVANFEKAIRLCQGDIIALADQDDVWHPDKLRRLMLALASTPDAGFAFSDGEAVDENLRPLGYTLWKSATFTSAERNMIERGKLFDVLLRHNVVTGATMAFRSTFKELVLPIPRADGIIHDAWTALLIAAVANAIFINEPLIKYRQHPGQQIGVAPQSNLSISERLAKERQAQRAVYAEALNQLKLAEQRLVARKDAFHRKGSIEKLRGQVAHWQARSAMPRNRLRRLPVVLRELIMLRYYRHSHGLHSAARDILL